MAGRLAALAVLLTASLFTAGAAPVMLAARPAAPAGADEPKLPDVKAFDKLVVDALRDVHNRGADLYNMKKEFEGTYRMYQGALVAVRPLLGHRPDAQKMIDDGLLAAEKEMSTAQKAFKLHEAIEGVRAHLRGETPKKPDDKKPPEDKNPVPVASGGPGFRGTVTFKGQPLLAGDVIFVSLDQPKPRVFTATIQGDGQYAPMGVVPPGKYVVIVTGKGVPEKYQFTTTSGLTVDVGPPPSVFNIELK